MTDNASREDVSYRERQVPHPVVDKYYASERDRRPFLLNLFDGASSNYDLVCALLSLGSGQSYRGAALKRSGLCAGTTLLDVAVGTGLVARAAMDHWMARAAGSIPRSP